MGVCVSHTLEETGFDDSNMTPKQFAVSQLTSISIFSKVTEDDELVYQELQFMPGEDIVVQGDAVTDLIYVLRSGVCEVYKDGTMINTLNRCSVIGERAFIAETTRSATVKAKDQCVVVAIERPSLEKALGFDKFDAKMMKDEEIQAQKIERLEQFPLLSCMTPEYIQNLASKMSIKQYLPGQTIMDKGEIGDEFYFIDRGSIAIIDDDASKIVLPEAELSPSHNKRFKEDSDSSNNSSVATMLTPSGKLSKPRVQTPGSHSSFESMSNSLNSPLSCSPAVSNKDIVLEGLGGLLREEEEEEYLDTNDENNSALANQSSNSLTSKNDYNKIKAALGNPEGPIGSPLHIDTQKAINIGMNDFLNYYEAKRMRSLGGFVAATTNRKKKKKLTGKKRASLGSSNSIRMEESSNHHGTVNSNINTIDGIEYLTSDDSQNEYAVKAILRHGQFFGEMALMEGSDGRRSATVLARTHVTLLAMKKDSFRKVMAVLQGEDEED